MRERSTKTRQFPDNQFLEFPLLLGALGVPFPYLALWIGFAIQYVGGVLVLLDVYTCLGASLLILFTVLATVIFHRFWLTPDLLMRHIHKSIIFSNIGIIGALLLLL